MKKISVEELAETLKKHRLWRRGEPGGKRADLSGTDLHGRDLSYENLSHADLSQSNLSRANLIDANLINADLLRAMLTDANLSNACLINANLSRANLSRANLSRADLSHANLARADLADANLTDADLFGVVIVDAVGNGKEIKSYQGLEWSVVWTKDQLAIGCEQHPIDQWKNFTDEEISDMGEENEDTLTFWRKHKDFILTLIEREC